MASTATGSVASVSGVGRSPRRLKSVDLDRLAPLVPAAARAHDVRRLGRLAVRADAARPGGRAARPPPGGCGPWPWTSSSWGRPSRSPRSVRGARALVRRCRPAGTGYRSTSRLAHRGSRGATQPQSPSLRFGPALRAQAGAVVPAQRRQGQLEHDRRRARAAPRSTVVVDDRVRAPRRRAGPGRRRSARARGSSSSPETGSAQRRHDPDPGRPHRPGRPSIPPSKGLEDDVDLGLGAGGHHAAAGVDARPRRAGRPARPRPGALVRRRPGERRSRATWTTKGSGGHGGAH